MRFKRDAGSGIVVPENFGLASKLSGRYRIEKVQANRFGKPKETTRRVVANWFPNLITDLGLNKYGDSNNWLQYCQVGTGNTAPAVGDTNLAAYVAGQVNNLNNDEGARGSAPYYCWKFMGYRFAAGVAEGNIAEIGVGSTSATGNLFSRALILDGGGSPTTITVQSDEILDCYYESRIYPPLADTSGVIDLDGETYDWTGRACNVTSGGSSTGWSYFTYGVNANNNGAAIAYDGNIGAITGVPGGNSTSSVSLSLAASYSSDSYETEHIISFGVSQGNLAAGIRSLAFRMGASRWQVEFAAQSDGSRIPKDNTKVLAINVKHSWARQ